MILRRCKNNREFTINQKNGYNNICREDIKKIITSTERYGGGGQALSGCNTVKFIH